MARQVVSSGGPLEQIYGYSRAVRVGAHVHVAGTAARGEALTGDAHVQTQNILGTIRGALEQAGARIEDVVRRSFTSPTSAMPNRWSGTPRGVRRCPSGQHHGTGERPHPPEMRVEIEAYAVIDEAAYRTTDCVDIPSLRFR